MCKTRGAKLEVLAKVQNLMKHLLNIDLETRVILTIYVVQQGRKLRMNQCQNPS